MERATFETIDPILDQIAEMVDGLLESDPLSNLRDALVRLNEALGSDGSVSLNLSVGILDPERRNMLPLLTTGLVAIEGKPPFQVRGDSSPQKYVTEDGIQVVPHDRCPQCYGAWDFKFENRRCPGCGATLGETVKVLLDSDVCPHCEEGKVTTSSPSCEKCGYRVVPNLVVWG